jgi:predicted acylesterase/phospholipase RssA
LPLDRSHARRGDGSSKRPFIESGPRQHVDARNRPSAIEGGEIFVDGGLVNTLPVDVMKRLCPGKVVAVDVSEQVEFQSALQESYGLSGWDLFWRRLDPSEYSLPRDYSRRDRRHRGRARSRTSASSRPSTTSAFSTGAKRKPSSIPATATPSLQSGCSPPKTRSE